MAGTRGHLKVHACAFTGRDVDTLAAQAHPNAVCFCDGEFVGEGPEGIRAALLREYAANDEVIGRVAELDGELVVAELAGPDGSRSPRGALRFHAEDDRIRELRITHDPKVVARLGFAPSL